MGENNGNPDLLCENNLDTMVDFDSMASWSVYLLDFFCSGIQFYVLLSPYLCFISFYILIYMFWEVMHG